jgi:hypothetical protein
MVGCGCQLDDPGAAGEAQAAPVDTVVRDLLDSGRGPQAEECDQPWPVKRRQVRKTQLDRSGRGRVQSSPGSRPSSRASDAPMVAASLGESTTMASPMASQIATTIGNRSYGKATPKTFLYSV